MQKKKTKLKHLALFQPGKTRYHSSYHKFRFTTPTTTTALRGDQQPRIDEDDYDDIPDFYSINGYETWSSATISPIYRTDDFRGLVIHQMSYFY